MVSDAENQTCKLSQRFDTAQGSESSSKHHDTPFNPLLESLSHLAGRQTIMPCLNRHWEGKVVDAIRAEQEKAGQAEKQWQGRLGEVSGDWQAKLAQGQVQWEKDRAAAEQAWREAKSQAEQQWKQQLDSIQHAHRSVLVGLVAQLWSCSRASLVILLVVLFSNLFLGSCNPRPCPFAATSQLHTRLCHD